MQAPDVANLKREQTGCISHAGHESSSHRFAASTGRGCWARGSSVTLPGRLAGGLTPLWVGGRLGAPQSLHRHGCSMPGDSLPRPELLLAVSSCLSPVPGEQPVHGAEAQVPSLFWGLLGAGLFNGESSVGSGAGGTAVFTC